MTTTVVFIRHAAAEEGAYRDDASRPLSPLGLENQRKVTLILKNEELEPDLILCSPYQRSQQTADIIASILPTEIEVQPCLAPNEFDEEFLIDRLNPPRMGEIFFIVGHEPSLSQFITDLVGQPCLPRDMEKSGCAVLEFDEEIDKGKGRFIAYYHP